MLQKELTASRDNGSMWILKDKEKEVVHEIASVLHEKWNRCRRVPFW